MLKKYYQLRVLILDEPTASLDSESSRLVQDTIVSLRAAHPETTVICVTHDEEVKKLGGRVIEMHSINKKKAE